MKTILDQIGRRPVVVITDRYPPRARGGAELSLHLVLRELPDPSQVLVVTFQDDHADAKRYVVDGVTVVELPSPLRWPNHAQPSGAVAQIGAELAARRDTDGAFPRDGLSPLDVEHLELAISRAKPKGGVVCDFAEFPQSSAATVLRDLLQICQPRLVHADNYRSILLATVATRGMQVKRVGVVRDNRFHCARHNQSANVEGRLCGLCDLACAPLDSPDAVEVQRYLLERSLDFRQSCLRAMDKVVCTSEFLESRIAPVVGIDSIVRIPVAPEDAETVANLTRGVAELPGMNILVVGMVNENKGQLELARRIDELTLQVPDAVVDLAGRGERVMKGVRAAAAAVDLSDRIVEHGFVDRDGLYALYRKCQIVLLPTIWTEGFGRVPLEAGMSRRPVVAFAAGGLTETIVDGVTGYLVEHGDFPALFSRVAELSRDAALRYQMGERAYARVLAAPNVSALNERLLRLWRESGAI